MNVVCIRSQSESSSPLLNGCSVCLASITFSELSLLLGIQHWGLLQAKMLKAATDLWKKFLQKSIREIIVSPVSLDIGENQMLSACK